MHQVVNPTHNKVHCSGDNLFSLVYFSWVMQSDNTKNNSFYLLSCPDKTPYDLSGAAESLVHLSPNI